MIESIFEYLQEPSVLWSLTGIVALALLLVLISRFRSRRRKVTAFESRYGKVRVSQLAILDLVQRTCQSADGVEKCVTQLRMKGDVLTGIDLRLHIRANIRLNVLKEELDAEIHEILQSRLSIEGLDEVNISIDRIVGDATFTGTPKRLRSPEDSPQTDGYRRSRAEEERARRTQEEGPGQERGVAPPKTYDTDDPISPPPPGQDWTRSRDASMHSEARGPAIREDMPPERAPASESPQPRYEEPPRRTGTSDSEEPHDRPDHKDFQPEEKPEDERRDK